MSVEDFSERVLKHLYVSPYPHQGTLNAVFHPEQNNGNPSEQERELIKRFLMTENRLCETVPSGMFMEVIKLTDFGIEVMNKYGSYSAYLSEQSENLRSEKRWEKIQKANAFADLARNYWWVIALVILCALSLLRSALT